ncbi:hypothetical protein GLP25_08365 [Photobacterium phosphoreum]|uniref:hypothetical protein n=1 Tax=Photobacterium phosphoreum TaxID=659 RepID=UPI001E2B91DA|nr:hypothetical protein [Photobacterium phosphoreum]MCD9483202.1 hypothetical protein [Photobacterium phosphoreum]
MASAELIDWVRLGVISIGATVALVTYKSAQRQRKLENSLKLLELFHKNIEKSDIGNWKALFQSSSEPSGAKKGHFVSSYHQQVPLTSLFSEGPEDHGATVRITEQIDLICYEVLKNNIELRIIYSNLGQLMDVIYRWFGDEAFFKEYYPYFNKIMIKKKKYLSKLPSKTIAYCE